MIYSVSGIQQSDSVINTHIFILFQILYLYRYYMILGSVPCAIHEVLLVIYFVYAAATVAKSLQSCPTLCNPIDGSPPGSPIPGILQARILEWVAISFSNAGKEKGKWSRSVMSDSWRPHGLRPTRLLHPGDFPGKSTGMDCLCLLQGIFPIQESNPGLLHCGQILYQLSY